MSRIAGEWTCASNIRHRFFMPGKQFPTHCPKCGRVGVVWMGGAEAFSTEAGMIGGKAKAPHQSPFVSKSFLGNEPVPDTLLPPIDRPSKAEGRWFDKANGRWRSSAEETGGDQ